MIRTATYVLVCAFTLGCSTGGELIAVEANALVQDAKNLAGYKHLSSCSRFRVGKSPMSDRAFGFDRIVGDEGVLAYGRHDVTLGVPNADAPSLSAAPFAGTPEQHTSRVLQYFADECGLPKGQLGPTYITTLMRGAGAVVDRFDGKEDARPQFLGYNTVLTRSVEGILVRGSYAWARFNSNDDVVAEEVYWPELPSELLKEAIELKTILADDKLKSSVLSKLPSEHGDAMPEVNIYHSPHFQEDLEAYVTLMYPDTEDGRRFRPDGTELRFESEIDDSSKIEPQRHASE